MAKKKPAAPAVPTFTPQKLTRAQLVLLKDVEDVLKRREPTADLDVLQKQGLVDDTFRVTTLGSEVIHVAKHVENCL